MAEISEDAQYLISLCPRVREVCEPLYKHLGIKFFRFVTSYPDGSKFCLSSDEEWLRSYFEEEFYNKELSSYHKAPPHTTGISIHGSCVEDNPVCEFWNRHAHLCHYSFLLDIYEKTDDYFDVFCFGISDHSHVAVNVLLNNFFLFKHFMIYFYDVGRDLIKEGKAHRFLIEEDNSYNLEKNWMLGIQHEDQKAIINEMKVKRFYLDTSLDSQYLTSVEVKLLKLFSKGYNETDLADKFKLPPERIQDYFDGICVKLGASNRAELLATILRQPLASRLANFYFQ